MNIRWTRANKKKLLGMLSDMFPSGSLLFREFMDRNGIEFVFPRGGVWTLENGMAARREAIVEGQKRPWPRDIILENPWGGPPNSGLRIPNEVAKKILESDGIN